MCRGCVGENIEQEEGLQLGGDWWVARTRPRGRVGCGHGAGLASRAAAQLAGSGTVQARRVEEEKVVPSWHGCGAHVTWKRKEGRGK